MLIPYPQKNESPFSVLMRAASANGWEKLSTLLRTVLGVATDSQQLIESRLATERTVRDLYQNLGIPIHKGLIYKPAGLPARTSCTWHGLAVPNAHIRRWIAPLCPACVSEDEEPYLRTDWDHVLAVSCRIHEVALLFDCPWCNSVLTRDRLNVAMCECGFDLGKAKTRHSSCHDSKLIVQAEEQVNSELLPAVVALAADLESLKQKKICKVENSVSSACAIALQRLRVSEALERVGSPNQTLLSTRILLQNLLCLDSDEARKLSGQVLAELDAAGMRSFGGSADIDLTPMVTFTDCMKILGTGEQFTKRIIEGGILRAQEGRNKRRSATCLDDLNKLLLQLEEAFLGNSIKSMKDCRLGAEKSWVGTNANFGLAAILDRTAAIRSYKLESGIKGMTFSLPIRPGKQFAGYVDVKELANRAKCHAENIRFLVKIGFFQGVIQHGTKYFIDKEEAKKFCNEFVFAGVLAKSIDENPTNFAEKLRHWGITPASGPDVDGGLTYLFRRCDTQAIDLKSVARTKRYATRTGRKKASHVAPTMPGLSLSDVSKGLSCSVGECIQLLDAGYLEREPSPLRRVFVSSKSFDEYRSELESPQWVNVDDAAAEMLETANEFRRRWVMTGLIESRNLILKRQVSRRDLVAVKRLKRNYVIGSEAGRLLGSHRTHMSNQARIGFATEGTLLGVKESLRIYRRDALPATNED